MIDTVFYFAPSFEEYQSQWQNDEISRRTIVFVPSDDDRTGAIYKGGVCYGNATETNIRQIVEEMLAEYVPNWPKATKNSLGGVIVGSNLDVDSAGTIDINFDADRIKAKIKEIINAAYMKGIINGDYIRSFIDQNPQQPTTTYTLPAASTSTRGGIRVGKNLQVSDTDKLDVNSAGVINDIKNDSTFIQWLNSLGLGGNGGSTVSYTPGEVTNSTQGKYTIGTITINGTSTELLGKDTGGGVGDIQPASTTTLGGIKLHDPNTPLGNREYAVKLNGDNKAYVYVPWEKGEGNNEDDTTVKMQRTFFLNVEHGVEPQLPLTSDYDSQSKSFIDTRNNVTWTYNNTNPTGTQDTYQIWAWIVGNTAMSVDGPIKVRDGVQGG